MQHDHDDEADDSDRSEDTPYVPEPGFRLFFCGVSKEAFEVPLEAETTWCPSCGYKFCSP